MTTFNHKIEPYNPPPTFEHWLQLKGIPDILSDVFNWHEERTLNEYNGLFNRIESINDSISVVNMKHQELHKSRLDYMKDHEINKWRELDETEDAIHLAKRNEFSKKIRDVHFKGRELKKSVYDLYRCLALLAGIIDGWYNEYDCIIRDEAKIHGLMSTNNYDPMWRDIGPIHNPFWRMYPRLEKIRERDRFSWAFRQRGRNCE